MPSAGYSSGRGSVAAVLHLMARPNRLVIPGQVHHVCLQAVSGSDAFVTPSDYALFLEALLRAAVEHRTAIHVHSLTQAQAHLMVTPEDGDDLGRMMQAVARLYVGSFNRRQGRAGSLWQSRYRAAPVGGAAELLSCMRYVEQAPRRLGWLLPLVDYPWSSAAHHAGARFDQFLSPVPAASAYWALGNTPFEREAAYGVLLENMLPRVELDRVEATTLKGWVLGSGEFIASFEPMAARRPEARPRGRPRKASGA
jgi:putative transposase